MPEAPHAEWKPSPSWRAVLLLGPVLVTAVIWLVVRHLAGHSIANQLAAAAGASIFGFGTTVILGPAVLPEVTDLTPWNLAWMVMYLNGAVAFFYAYNLDLLERLPGIGPPLRRARANAVASVEQRPWIRRWATVGVGVFVFLPLPGSGSLGGCVVGRIVGLSRIRAFATATVAGAGVCVIYAWFGDLLEAWGASHPVSTPVKIAAFVVVLVALWLLSRWVTRLSRREKPSGPP